MYLCPLFILAPIHGYQAEGMMFPEADEYAPVPSAFKAATLNV
jgi:hypothetical protein